MKKTNLRRYSDRSHKSWLETPAVFTKTDLLIKNYQVMERWEDNYMKSLASIATSHGGNILEVGFGLGMSARFIEQSKKIKTHTIIEAHPDVIKTAKKYYKNEIEAGRVILLHGFWEDITPQLKDKSFDGILFDSCPLDSGVEFFQFFNFFSEAYRLLKDDGIFTYFSDEAKEISKPHINELKKAGFLNIKFKICKVHPPKTCEYWKHKTIVSPIIKKV